MMSLENDFCFCGDEEEEDVAVNSSNPEGSNSTSVSDKSEIVHFRGNSSATASFLSLPRDLLRCIFWFLEVEAAWFVQQVCMEFKKSVNSEDLMKKFFLRDIGSELHPKKSNRVQVMKAVSDTFRMTPKDRVWCAARSGWDQIVKRTVGHPSKGVSIDVLLGNRATVLETASLREHKHVIDVAFELGCNPYIGDQAGDSAMHLSVCTNKLKSVEALLNNGCDPLRFPTLLTGPLYSDSPEFGRDPLARYKMIHFLLQHGFKRPVNVIRIALQSAIAKHRVPQDQLDLWNRMLDEIPL